MKMDANFEDEIELEHGHETVHTHSIYGKGKDKKHKLMTMEDVAKQLSDNLSDEISDSRSYLCMANIAERANDYDDCHYLTEMAKDEYTHAYFIYKFMKEHDICIPEDQEKDFECLRETMKDFFQ